MNLYTSNERYNRNDGKSRIPAQREMPPSGQEEETMNAVTFMMIQYLVMFLLIVGVIQLLKLRGIFNDSHQPVFDRLVTEFALPAIVFGLLTTTTLRAEWILPVLIVNCAVIIGMLIAWGVCRALGLSPAVTGTIVILSAWGSTYTVGAPVLGAVFGLASEEASLGNVLGVFGFALPFFTLGILIAGYFGLQERGEELLSRPVPEKLLLVPGLPCVLAWPHRIRVLLGIPSSGSRHLL